MRLTAILIMFVAVPMGTARADDRAAARELYKRASVQFDLGHYHEAAKAYEAAYEAKNEFILLYDAAQAYRLAGEYDEALALYKSYLRRAPADVKNRAETEEHIRQVTNLKVEKDQREAEERLRKQEDERRAAAAAAAAPPAAPAAAPAPSPAIAPSPPAASSPARDMSSDERSARAGRRKAALALGVVGIALVGASVALAVLANSAGNQISHPAAGQKFDPALETRGVAFQDSAIAGFAVGGAAIATGVLLYAFGREPRISQVALRPVPVIAPGYAGFGVALSY